MTVEVRVPAGVPLALLAVAAVAGALGWVAVGTERLGFGLGAASLVAVALERASWRLRIAGEEGVVSGLRGVRRFRTAEVRGSFRRRVGSRMIPSEPEDAEDLVLWGPPGLAVRVTATMSGYPELAAWVQDGGRRVERLPPPTAVERAAEAAGPLVSGAVALAALGGLVLAAGGAAALLADTAGLGDPPTVAGWLVGAALGAWMLLLGAGQWLVRSTRALRDPGQVGLRGLAMGLGLGLGVSAVVMAASDRTGNLGLALGALVMVGLALAPNRGG